MSGYRLSAGGTGIDRDRPVGATFAGRPLAGFAGDTLASALIANGIDVCARSFKLHRPRGVVCAGPEEPSALVTLGPDGDEPNARATTVPLTDGLVASSQNAWPSLSLDVMALNQLGGRLFAAGFYYKTFMGGPRGTWTKVFEPVIRRAAGMGRVPKKADDSRAETVNAFCDVLVVGAGPAGLAAARTAAAAGLRVIMCDERLTPGGALLAETAAIDGQPAPAFASAAAEAARAAGATLLPATTVVGHYDGQFAAVERVAERLAAEQVSTGDGAAPDKQPSPTSPRERLWLIRPRRVILATGATERPAVFAGNDRPGVMLAEAVRTYANRYGVAAGRRVVLFTAHDGAYRTARDLAAAGVAVAAIVDARAEVPAAAAKLAAAIDAPLYAGAAVAAAQGARRVRGALIAHPHGTTRIDADTIAVSAGWSPNVQLTAQASGAPIWDDALTAFRPGALPDTWQAVGALDGAFGIAACLHAGGRAGAVAASELGRTPPPVSAPTVERDDLCADEPAPLYVVPALRSAKDKAFVDLQHDVTTDDIRLAADEGFTAVEHLKRYTTLGMAADQGKTSNVNALALLAAARGVAIPDVGTTRFRPPVVPVALGTLAGASEGSAVRPVRRTPLADWHDAHGVDLVATGAFWRPRAYPNPGESVAAAGQREAAAVRQAVGLVDVSTLGKIEVAGPDAATFLDRVYVNGWSTLPVGKARYGVMLRDDGMVLDDGTTWRLAEHRFLMTTTTAAAAKVLTHLEMLHATAWPDLKVAFTSLSDAYAAMALAGPRARDVLAAAVEGAVDDAALPFMAVRAARCAGHPVWLARLSFSGERAYEVFCGAGHGLAVWQALMAAGAAHGITPYGTEALGILRIEKGHVSSPELDGRVSLDDLGLARLASRKKAFVGAVMRGRPALNEPARLRLVGLTAAAPIPAGAQLIGPTGAPEGHVTSPARSPELDLPIALALLSHGPERHGESLVAAAPLTGERVPVTVTDPVFVDPEGTRVRG